MQAMAGTLRLILLLLLTLPILAACGEAESTPEQIATPTISVAEATVTQDAQPTVTPTAPIAAEPALTPTQIPPTATATPPPTATPTVEPTPLAQAQPTEPPMVYLPDPRPVDQHVELPDVDAHYALNITEMNVDTGFVRASQTITMREFRQGLPDQIYLQVVPAGYGFFTLDSLALNGEPITPGTLNDGFTLVLDLPGGLQAPAMIDLEYHLNVGIDPTGWGYTMLDADVLRLGYWFPAISDDHGMSNLLDPSYTRVADFDVTVVTEAGMPVAHTGRRLDDEHLDGGMVRQRFVAVGARDFALVFSRNFQVSRTVSATGVEIEYYGRSASDSGISAAAADQRRQNILFWTADAVDQLSALMGPYPFSTLRIVDAGPRMPAGVEFTMLIYLNPNYSSLDRLIYHEVAHQWFFAIIGTRTLIDGWIDEGGAEFFERGLPTGFTEIPPVPPGGFQFPLDAHYREILDDPRSEAYFAIYEQGARLYYDVMGLMGWDAFWESMRELYDRYSFDIVTAWDLLALWQRHSDVDLRPTFNQYFRYEWIDDLPDPGVELQQGWVPILAPRSTMGADRD
jgi:hypothetical protein